MLTLSSIFLLVSGLPLKLLPEARTWSWADLIALLACISSFVAVMAPLDLLGGFLLPNRSRPHTVTFGAFTRSWIRGVVVQSSIFLLTSFFILAMGRWVGVPGAFLAVLVVAVGLIAFQLELAKLTAKLPVHSLDQPDSRAVVAEALQRTSDWGLASRQVIILEHGDTGFTGGVVGLPGMETIIIPSASLTLLSPEQLAITIARRLEVVQSGSRSRGVLLAIAWVITGFVLSVSAPGAGVTSVGELAMTCVGFAIWTFIGLLTLPTLSRQASYAIDRRVVDRGASSNTLHETLTVLDRLQDDEPTRSTLIETIFHPVPSLGNRRNEQENTCPIAWHSARMTLYLSLACMGLLTRAVHCNVGRPELWVMFPTD